MQNQQKGISSLVGIIIIVAAAILVGGGILAYQYGWQGKTGSVAQLTSFEISPSCEAGGGIIFPDGAKAIAKGENLSKVEFWVSPPGTGLGDQPFRAGTVTKNGNQWEAVLPSDYWVLNMYAVGYDSNGNKVGKIALGKSIFGPDSSGGSPKAPQYPDACETN